jgi:hypothetical protein
MNIIAAFEVAIACTRAWSHVLLRNEKGEKKKIVRRTRKEGASTYTFEPCGHEGPGASCHAHTFSTYTHKTDSLAHKKKKRTTHFLQFANERRRH